MRRAAAIPVLVVVVLVVVLAPVVTSAEPAGGQMKPEARLRYGRGMSHFAAREFDAAAKEFEAAHALDARAEILFAWAQATRLGGDCPGAELLFRRFLDTAPPPQQVEATNLALARCREPVPTPSPLPGQTAGPVVSTPAAAAKAPDSAPGPITPIRRPPLAVRGAPPPAPLPADPPSPPRRWYSDPAGGALAAGAVVAAGLGAGFLTAAFAARERDRPATDYEEHAERADKVETRAGVAVLGFMIAALLGGGAVARYVWIDRGGAGIAATGRF